MFYNGFSSHLTLFFDAMESVLASVTLKRFVAQICDIADDTIHFLCIDIYRHVVCENQSTTFAVMRSERLPFSTILDPKSHFLTGRSFFIGVKVRSKR